MTHLPAGTRATSSLRELGHRNIKADVSSFAVAHCFDHTFLGQPDADFSLYIRK